MIAIFLVALLAVSGVSAADNATEDIASVEETRLDVVKQTTDEVVSDEMAIGDKLEIVRDENLSTTYAVSGNTFKDIQNTIDLAKSGDVIELSGTYYGNGEEIFIDKNITIDGKGHATLDAKKLSRIFHIDSYAEGFSLKNINFINGNADGNKGGAVFLEYVSNVKISGCTFRDNFARNGGAIYASGDNVNISDCNFINDGSVSEVTVKEDGTISYKSCSGGAIYIGFDTHNYYIDSCSFINCSSGGESPDRNGAIYSAASNLNIFNCEFADGFGGAIEVKKTTRIVDCNFINYTFIRNDVLYSGIPLVELGGFGSIMSNCNFIGNWAGMLVLLGGDGGTLSNCDFKNNIIFDNVVSVSSYDKSLIYKCNFVGNGYNYDYLPVISISKMLFSRTSGYTNLTIRDIVIEDTVQNIYGGAVTLADNILTIVNSASAKGEITVRISDKTFTKSVQNGKTQFDLSSVNPGTYMANIYYSGDTYEYKPSEMNIPITIKSSIKLKSDDVIKYFGGAEKFTVKLTKGDKALSNVYVKISANGKTYSVKTDSNGRGSTLLDLPVGSYNVVSSYDGVSTTSKVTVKSTITTSDASGTYSNSKVSATFLDATGKALASKQVTFKIGDETYSATTNSNGVATANIPLGVGTYIVSAVNPVNNEQKTFKLTISKADSKITLTSTQSNGVTTLTATLTPTSASGNVVFNVKGENKNVQINNGKAMLRLNDLEPGSYVVIARYAGDSNLNTATSNTVTFNVAEVYPILTAKGLTKTYGTANKFVVNLVDSKGNAIANAVVNVKINNVITPITTDSNGQATMPINLAPATYTATVTYGNDAQATAKITVKKANPKMTASAKTFKKSDKTKKYTVTLKTNKNVAMKSTTVKITVNKVTYSAKTNNKGQATFKLTKLTKKGTFTATVKYSGSKYYNTKTVKPKITVK